MSASPSSVLATDACAPTAPGWRRTNRFVRGALIAVAIVGSLAVRASDIVETGPKTYPTGISLIPGTGSGGVISTSNSVMVPNGSSVTYRAATQIRLESGFSVIGGGTFTAQVVPVPVPDGLTPTAIAPRSITLQWSSPPSSLGSPTYEIRRDGTSVGTYGGTQASFVGLLPGTAYAFTMRVSDVNGNWSDWSPALTVTTTADTTPPTIPSGFVPRSVSSTSLVLNWNASTESTTWVSNYEIRVDGISRGTVTDSSYEITGLNPNTRYAIQVRARDWSGNWSPWSDTYIFITPAAGLTFSGENSYSNSDGSSGWTRTYINQTGTTIKVHSTYDETYSDNAFGTDRHDADTVDLLAPNQLFNEMEATDVFAEQGYTEHRIQTMTWIETVGVPIVTAATTRTDPANLPLTYTLTANNTPTSFSATGLPPGLTLASTGAITGTPTTAGTYRVAVSATNTYGTGNGTIVWTVIVDTDGPTSPGTPYLTDLGNAPDFTLNWAASTDNIAVTAYEVLKNGTTIGTYTANSAPISFTYANSDYTVTVRARDASGNWSLSSAPLVVHTNGVSVVGGAVTPGASVPGSKHRLTAEQPPIGKYFSGWTMTGPGTVDHPAMEIATFTAGSGNTILTANYADGYRLRTYLDSDGNSPITMAAAGGAAGQVIAIHAPPPNAGDVFAGWNLIGPGMIESAGGRDTTITLGPGPSIIWPSYWSGSGPGLITALSGPPQTADVSTSFNFLNSIYRLGSPLTGALYVDYSMDGGLSWTMSVYDHNPNLSWQGTAPYSNNLASYSFWSTMSFAQAGTVIFRTWGGSTVPGDYVPIIPTFRKTQVSVAGTLPWTPLNIRAENVADTSFTLRWDAAPGCPTTVAYEVYVTGYAHEGIMGSNGTNTFTNVGSLTPGNTYTFKVRARTWTETSAWSAPITITSSTPPVITSPTIANAAVGQTFQYRIVATNQPTSYGASGTLPPGLSFDASSGILSGTPTAAGAWTVVLSATNASGTDTASLAITSVQLPTIAQQPASVDSVVGQPISFGVTATGTPTLAYQWKKNGIAIGGATTTTLSLASVTTADAGYYTVTVTNAGGSITSNPATLTVATDAAPTIAQQPSSLSVVAGQPGGFSVRASGNPSPTYQWKKNGAAISGATSSTYVLSSTAAADAGDYTVTVANSAGSVTSSVATLTVAAVNTAPTISWVELPDSATVLHPGDPFYVQAQGQDADGNLTAVAVWRVVDGADVVSASAGGGDGKTSVTPRVASGASAAGTITFKAKATDASGATSPLITYTVTIVAAEVPPNVAPTIAWTQGPATAVPGATFTVQAHATDENSNLASVQIWRDGQTPLSNGAGSGHDNDSPALQYSQAAAGPALFHAKAIDSDGASTTIDLTVNIAAATPSSDDVNKPVALGTGDLVGTLPGSLSVDNKGTANYTISLPTPPGRAGLQPNLAVTYNSGAGNGPVGLGWSISTGFPQAITRGRTILARDGFVGGPNLGEYSVRLYLDGRRLIQTSPGVASSYAFKDPYWKIGSKYRTEVDSFAELTSTSADTAWVDGFTMTNKDGSVAKFGIVDSDNDAVDYAPDYNGVRRGEERAWAIKQLTDALGNQVVFAYTNYTDAAGKRTGEQHIESITYTSNPGASVSADSRIRFLYSPEDPDDPAVRPDRVKSSYLGGSELRRRLSKIEVDVRTAGGDWETMRRFGFVYEIAPKSGLSRLSHVTSAWKDAPGGNWKSIPSTELTYQDDPNPKPVFDAIDQSNAHGTGDRATAVTGDFNGDGKTDRFVNGEVFLSDGDGFTTGQQWINFASISGYAEFVKTGDFDGDGKTDIAWMGGAGGDQVYIARSNGHGFEPLSGPGGTYAISALAGYWFDFGGTSLPKGTRASRMSVGDFNGDGRADILIHAASDRLDMPRGLYVALSHGNGFDAFRKWGDTNSMDALGYFETGVSWTTDSWHQVPEYASIEPIVADFNGDGVDDYAWVCRRTMADLARLDAFGQSTFSGPYVALDITVNVVFSLPWTPRKFSDVSQIHWQNNDGDNPNITAADYILQCIPSDVNGDGLTDLLVLGKNTPGSGGQTEWILYRNNGYGPFDRVEKYMPVGEWVGETLVPTYNQNYEQTLNEAVNLNYAQDNHPEYTYTFDEKTLNGHIVSSDLRGITEETFEGPERSWIQSSYSTDEKEQSGGMFLVDINHDGHPDYVWGLGSDVDGSGWWVKYGTPEGFGPAQKLWASEDLPFPGEYSPYTNMETREGGVSLETIDIDGDGAADLLLTARSNDDMYFGPVLAKTSGAHADRLIKVTDGLGSTSSLAYLTTANTAIYTPGVDVSYPIRERRGGQHVVSDVWRDSGGSTPAHFSYQYSGNRFDLSGRGPLGFHSFVTLDEQTGLFKYQFLTQSFPMTGLTAREETYRYLGSGDFHMLSSHDNTVVFDEVVKSPTDKTPWGTVYPFISRAVESRWENTDGADFSLGDASQRSQSESLFPLAKPAGAHIKITAESLFDSQAAAQTTLPDAAAGNGKFNASDTTTSSANAVTGVTSFSSIQNLGLPRDISYGNLHQLTTDYGDGLTEKVVTEYKSPVGALTGLVDNVATTVTSPGYGTQAAPVKRYTYFGSTPLVETETIDASGDTLDLKTTYTRDSLGRVTDTTISNTTATGVQAIGTYSVGSVPNASFDSHFDLPTTIVNAAPYLHSTTTAYHRFFAQPVSVTDVNGAQATTVYDALGRAINVTDVLKGLSTDTSMAWTSSSATDWQKTQTVTPPTSGVENPVTLSSVYATRTTATVQPAVTAYYDRLGRVIRTIKEGFNDQKTVVDTVYDTLGRVVAVSLPYASGTTPLWTKTSYDSVGRVHTVTAPNGTVTTTTYNGRATSVTVDAPALGGVDPAAQTNTTVVNAKGQTIAVWNADNVPTFADTTGTATTNAIPSIGFALDGFGRMRKTTLKGQTQTITADYDDLGHQTTLNDPDKGPWSYVNNALGKVVQQTDANQNITITAFDHLGRTLSRATVEPNSGPTELADYFYYDTATTAASDPALHLVPQGSQGWIGALQRTEASTTGAPGYANANSATATAHYYDAKGRPTTDLTTIDGKWFYTYTSYTEPGGGDYSRVNQVRHYWLPGGAEDQTQTPTAWQDFGYTYSYDSKSYLLSLSDIGATSSPRTWWRVDPSTGYDYLDRPILVQKGNAYWTKRTYRPEDGVITSIATGLTQGATGIQNLAFTFDGLGNLRRRTSGSLTEDCDYDILNRLKSDKQGTISYFDNGNIKNKTGVAGDTTSDYAYSLSKPHAVSAAFGYSMGYDANGNLISRSKSAENWILKYAGFDKPRWMTKFGATTVGSEFLYNANRSRTVHLEYDQANATTGVPTHYLRKRIYGLGPTLEANYGASYPSGTLTWTLNKVRIYVPGPDGVIGAREFDNPTTAGGTEKALVYHYDHLGSIQGLTLFGATDGTFASDTGGKGGQFSEDAWGSRRNPTTWTGAPTTTDDGGADSLTPRGFTGHEMLDDLGLVHMNGRIYDPLIGRMLSADILVQNAGDLQSYNRYSYVRNNPLTMIDPSGFAEENWWTEIKNWWNGLTGNNNIEQNSIQPLPGDDIPGGAATRELLHDAKTVNRELNALPAAVAGGSAKAAAKAALDTFEIAENNSPISFVVKPLLETAHEGLNSYIDATVTDHIVAADGNPNGMGRALGEGIGATGFTAATIFVPLVGEEVMSMRAASLARSATIVELRTTAAAAKAAETTLAKSGAIPKTGVAFYDDLAVNSQHFDSFINGIRSRGWSVRSSEFMPPSNPAFLRPGNRTFYYNPNHFTKLDMLHEIQHFQQFKAAGNLKTGGGLLQQYEFRAYQFEFNLGTRNGFSGEYMQYLQQQMQHYGP